MSEKLIVRYAQSHIIPEDAVAAWGARLIVTQTGEVDFVGDRQAAGGEDANADELLEVLNARFGVPAITDAVRSLLVSYRMQTRAAEDFTLYSDDRLEVHANSNASYGYCYITAWLKPAA